MLSSFLDPSFLKPSIKSISSTEMRKYSDLQKGEVEDKQVHIQKLNEKQDGF